MILQRIRLHETCCHRLFNLSIKLFQGTNTFFPAILIAPDRQWCSPKTRTGKIPVVQVLQPVTKTTCPRWLRLPIDCLIQFHHPLLLCRVLNEPAIKRIIEDWLVCTPAVRVVMNMFLYFKCCALHFHLHTDDNVQVLCFLWSLTVPNAIWIEFGIVCILHVVTSMMVIRLHIHTFVDKYLIEFLYPIIFPSEIDHRTSITFLVNKI